VLTGGEADSSDGYFVQPTILESTDPTDEVFTTEYFGPILGVHVFDDAGLRPGRGPGGGRRSLRRSPGRSSRQDRAAIAEATDTLRFSAGQFLRQRQADRGGRRPSSRFGGARASGTNDKAGSIFNLIRWVNARAIKELFVPPTDYRYPHMG